VSDGPDDGRVQRRGRFGSRWVPGGRLVGHGPAVPDVSDDAPTVGVLGLQGDVLEHLHALQRSGARPVLVRTRQDLDTVDGLVIPGGESTTIGKLLQRFGLLDPLRDRLGAGMPAFGTCAGLILLSDRLDQDRPQVTLGGLDVTTRRNAFGRQVDSFEVDLDVTGVAGGPMRAVFIRAPFVVEHGAAVEVLAAVDHHPVVVRQGSILGASFHPELTGDNRLHRVFVGIVAG